MRGAGLAIAIEEEEDDDGAGPSSLSQLDLFAAKTKCDVQGGTSEAKTQTGNLTRGCEVDGKNDDASASLVDGLQSPMEMTTLTGQAVHLRPRRPPSTPDGSGGRRGRLATPFYQLLAKIDLDRQEAERWRAAAATEAGGGDAILTPGADQLWVEKYRPCRFMDLLAVDRANLDVLQWLSQWRGCIPIRSGDAPDAVAPKNSFPPSLAPAPKRPRRLATEAEGGIPSGWPEKRVLLIHGPPGLGKTTLVQVIARTVGFELVEINASEERSGEAVLRKVDAAIGSDSLLCGRRPNLLLIDEIDGALGTGGAQADKSLITHLLKLVAASGDGPPADSTDAADGDGEGRRTRRRPQRRGPQLRRPIICICNDLYVPALRPLRQVAHVVALRRPPPSALARRLGEICSAERVRAEGKALLELAELMDCDVRAAVHALQFISRQNIALTSGRLAQALSGLKDVHSSTAHVYDAILHKDSRGARSTRLDAAVLSAIADHGEYQTLAMGVFELFPRTKFYDDTCLSKVRAGLDCLGWVDLWESAGPDSPLSAYSPFALLQTHRLFASPVPAGPKRLFPREDYQRRLERLAFDQILEGYARGLPPSTRDDRRELALTRIPCVLPLIRAHFRVGNPQLLRRDERRRLRELAEVMLAEGLSYRQVRRPDGQYDFVLDP